MKWVFLSHLHIDHLIGFDHLLRVRLFSALPLHVFGPPGTTDVISHRLQGYAWNLTSGSPFIVHVQDATSERSVGGSASFHCHHQFQRQDLDPGITEVNQSGVRLEADIEVRWHPVNHGVPCHCYRLNKRVPPKFSLENCHRLGLSGGKWVRDLINGEKFTLLVQNETRDQDWLKERLLQEQPMWSLGFLTDTLLDHHLKSELIVFFREVDILMSETAYLDSEQALARENLHMTTLQVGRLAQACGAKSLRIFHLSRRYIENGPQRHLDEVRSVFCAANIFYASRWTAESPS